ncbi:MAG: NAD-dependent epimerase/dehydratase [Solirubrobacterales bacterium]|jgi:nucleoside-diphosphate-sugar epimerase|nr:NAD-dependent epimerase/dehydratase [Solirubrobacterales bacterium]
MSRVLLTGATGFVGRGALEPLLAAGLEVHAVSTRSAPTWSPAGVTWHRADLLAVGAAEDVVARIRPERLLHFAWDAEPGKFWTSTHNLRWVEATLALLRVFAEGGGQRAVLAGTCAEYAWTDETVCLEGVTRLEPATLYGAAKDGLRRIAEAHAAQAGYELAWGRIFFVFGPHEDARRLGGSVAAALASGQPAPTSHGEQVRDFLYAPELAEAFVAVLESSVTGALNVASGTPVPMRDLVVALGEASGRPELVQLGARPANPSEPTSLIADVSRLRDEVGWTPTRTLAEAATETMQWWTTEGTPA